MRRPAFSPIRFAPLLWVLIVPACFSLPKVDVVRVIDNFERDAGLQPTWGAFDSWTCGAYVDPDHAGGGGQDGGGDGGGSDASSVVTCSLDIGGMPDPNQKPPPAPGTFAHALVASFNLTAPYDLEVATESIPSDGGVSPLMPVSLTAFSQLSFDARLYSTSTKMAEVPPGTQLQVELRCSGIDPNNPLVEVVDELTLEAPSWKPVTLPFSGFTTTPKRQTCLANIDSIGFVVLLGSNVEAGTQVAGALSLDDIVLE